MGHPTLQEIEGASNRAQHGVKRTRWEPAAAEALEVIKKVKAIFMESHDHRVAIKTACMVFKREWPQLRRLLRKEEIYIKRAKASSHGLASRRSANKKGKNASSSFQRASSSGARARGAGRKDPFQHLRVQVRYWFEQERLQGHFVGQR